MTLPYPWQVRFNASGIAPAPRMDVPVDPALIDDLLRADPRLPPGLRAGRDDARRVRGLRGRARAPCAPSSSPTTTSRPRSATWSCRIPTSGPPDHRPRRPAQGGPPVTTEAAQPATLPILSHWIDGAPVEVLPEQTGPVYNPATGQVIARVPRGGAPEVDRAVAAAAAAFPAWRDTPLIARSQVFFAFRELRLAAPRGDGRAHHPRPRQDLPGRPRRGPARASRRSSSPAACRSTWPA